MLGDADADHRYAVAAEEQPVLAEAGPFARLEQGQVVQSRLADGM